MSPEQATGESEPDGRSDIYSFGAVAYYLLTGVPPFPGNKPVQVIIAHVHQEVTPPSQLRPDLPLDLEQIVLRCLAKDPRDRFQDVPALAAALADCSVAGQWSRDDASAWWKSNGTSSPKEAGELSAAAL